MTRQLLLFDTHPVAMPPRRPLEGTPPAPPRETGWIRSFLVPEQCPPLDPPPAARTRRTRRRTPRTLAELYAAATAPDPPGLSFWRVPAP